MRPRKKWFISDQHHGHKGALEWCKRPFKTLAEQDDVIIKRYNSLVQHHDTVYFLGDISFYPPSIGVPLLKRYYGEKILIRGNHDKYSYAQYKAAGFSAILQEAKIHIQGQLVKLSHYPYWPKEPEKELAHELRYPELRPSRDGGFLLCGHIHNLWKRLDNQLNIGVDQHNFTPWSEFEVAKEINLTHCA